MKEVSAISPNDITLENSLIYSIFFSSIPSQVQDQILIAFPPFHFVRKVLRDRSLNHLRITFLFNNRDVVDALKYQAGQGSYVPRVGKQVTFVEYSDWVRQNDDAKKYAHLLMFGKSLSILEREGGVFGALEEWV